MPMASRCRLDGWPMPTGRLADGMSLTTAGAFLPTAAVEARRLMRKKELAMR